jgi:hypothetical protein
LKKKEKWEWSLKLKKTNKKNKQKKNLKKTKKNLKKQTFFHIFAIDLKSIQF